MALQIRTRQKDNATTTATSNTVRNLATAIGLVLGSTIFSNEMSTQSAGLIASLGSEDGHLLSGGAALADVFVVHGLQGPLKIIAERAYFLCIRKFWILYAVLGGLGLLVRFFVSRKVLETQQQEVALGLDTEERKRKLAKGPKAGDRYRSMSFYYVCFLRHVMEGGLRGRAWIMDRNTWAVYCISAFYRFIILPYGRI